MQSKVGVSTWNPNAFTVAAKTSVAAWLPRLPTRRLGMSTQKVWR
jgi:hypothetical protein